MLRLATVGFVVLLAATGALAAGELKEGDKAPKLTYDEWIYGDTISAMDTGTAYLVEFWGTWCSPCLANIPRLNALQKKYAADGLIVLGVATHEFKGRETLLEFMKARGSEMEYRVAFDADQSMEVEWDTGGKEGVVFRMPLCFLVDRQGVIAFEGHPEDEALETALKKVLGKK